MSRRPKTKYSPSKSMKLSMRSLEYDLENLIKKIGPLLSVGNDRFWWWSRPGKWWVEIMSAISPDAPLLGLGPGEVSRGIAKVAIFFYLGVSVGFL